MALQISHPARRNLSLAPQCARRSTVRPQGPQPARCRSPRLGRRACRARCDRGAGCTGGVRFAIIGNPNASVFYPYSILNKQNPRTRRSASAVLSGVCSQRRQTTRILYSLSLRAIERQASQYSETTSRVSSAARQMPVAWPVSRLSTSLATRALAFSLSDYITYTKTQS